MPCGICVSVNASRSSFLVSAYEVHCLPARHGAPKHRRATTKGGDACMHDGAGAKDERSAAPTEWVDVHDVVNEIGVEERHACLNAVGHRAPVDAQQLRAARELP
jgi:hypothetical protein